MSACNLESLQPGEALPTLELAPITRLDLALYCGGSNDHNPIHVDSDSAAAFGLGDVIGHGMLSMAYLGRLLTSWVPGSRVRKFSCRFVNYTRIGDVPVLTGELKSLSLEGEAAHAVVTMAMTTRDGEVKVTGEATISLSD